MNHKKRKRPLKQGPGRNSSKMFRISTRRIKRGSGRRNRRYKKPNHWHQTDDRTYSKIVLRDVERLWLEEMAPKAVVSYEKVPNCESMPQFKSGAWNGMAYYVRFPEDDLHNAIMFRIHWWNTRA